MNDLIHYYQLLKAIVLLICAAYFAGFAIYLLINKISRRPGKFNFYDVGQIEVIDIYLQKNIAVVQIKKWYFVKYLKIISLDLTLYSLLKDYYKNDIYLVHSRRGRLRVTLKLYAKNRKKYDRPIEVYRI